MIGAIGEQIHAPILGLLAITAIGKSMSRLLSML
jgi:hypothetical protein